MTTSRYAHFVKVMDTGDIPGATEPEAQGFGNDCYIHGGMFEMSAGTLPARFRIHKAVGGAPVPTDDAYWTCGVSAESPYASIVFDPPILAFGGFDWGLATSAGVTARAHVFYTPAR